MDEISIPKRIHIAPVGFDQDRVVLPLKNMSAEKVYLIVEQKKEDDKGRVYVDFIQKSIKKYKLKCDVELRPSDVIGRDLFSVLHTYRKIIEAESGNKIYVNVSTGTKIHSIAGMMACMIFSTDVTKLTPYYVVPDDYNEPEDHSPFATGCKDIFPLPSYKITKPENKLVICLRIIEELSNEGKKISKISLIEKLTETGLLQVAENKTINAKYRSLERNFIEPLIEWNFISTKGKGKRLEIEISSEGKNILKFLG
jgi:hypothetical protein